MLKIFKSYLVDIIIIGFEVGKIDGWCFLCMICFGLLKIFKNMFILLIFFIYCECIVEIIVWSYGIDVVLLFEC